MVIPFEYQMPKSYKARKAIIRNKCLEKARRLNMSVKDSILNDDDKKSLLNEIIKLLE